MTAEARLASHRSSGSRALSARNVGYRTYAVRHERIHLDDCDVTVTVSRDGSHLPTLDLCS